jgi:curli biogenesis system outer membrane secretion channel CsgG
MLLAVGCFPYGFAGGGLPAHVKTVAVLPFENETAASEIQRELFELMRKGVQTRLGLREAAEDKADAVVRGTITRYDPDVPVAYSADVSLSSTNVRRRLQITVDVEIVDQTTGRVLWTRKSLAAEGEYAERAEPAGRKQAIERIINDIIEGAQSQW